MCSWYRVLFFVKHLYTIQRQKVGAEGSCSCFRKSRYVFEKYRSISSVKIDREISFFFHIFMSSLTNASKEQRLFISNHRSSQTPYDGVSMILGWVHDISSLRCCGSLFYFYYRKYELSYLHIDSV